MFPPQVSLCPYSILLISAPFTVAVEIVISGIKRYYGQVRIYLWIKVINFELKGESSLTFPLVLRSPKFRISQFSVMVAWREMCFSIITRGGHDLRASVQAL